MLEEARKTTRSTSISGKNVLWDRGCPNCGRKAYAFETRVFGVAEVCMKPCGYSVFPAVEDRVDDGYVVDLQHAVQMDEKAPLCGYPEMDVSDYAYQCEKNHSALTFRGFREGNGEGVLVCMNSDLKIARSRALGDLRLVGTGAVCGLEYDLPRDQFPSDWLMYHDTHPGQFFTRVRSPDGHRMSFPFLRALFMTNAGISGDWDILQLLSPKNIQGPMSEDDPSAS